MRFTALLPLVLAALTGPVARPVGQQAPLTFVVLGHIRGSGQGLSSKLGEVLDEVRRIKPDVVFLTGDIIWGDYNSKHTDSAAVEGEWAEVDSALATLGVPVYRVPGNHDINDAVTRDIWARRYGPLPQAVTIRGNRFLLLASGWVPAPGDTGKALYIRGRDLDPQQVAFLEHELAQPDGPRRTFVVMHHLLWWEPDSASWWRVVHPLLARAGVVAVFSGDYGPMKFSTLERDGVRYLQSSIEDSVPVIMQRNRIASRLLSSQLDNFLVGTVNGGDVRLEVRTVAALSSEQFTPARWRAINIGSPTRPAKPLRQQVWDLVGSPKRLAALGLGMVALFGAGIVVGGALRARSSRRYRP